MLLTASVFAAVRPERRQRLARALWTETRARNPLNRTTLLVAGRLFPEARALWTDATTSEKARVFAHLFRHRDAYGRYRAIRSDYAESWTFLCSGVVADALGRGEDGLDDGA